VFAAIGGYILFHTFASAPLVASLEAEQMNLPAGASVLNDSAASGGKAIRLTADGTATGSVSFPSTVTSLTVMARGDQCQGAPAMTVSLDGNSQLSSTSVSSTTWSAYSVTPTNAIASGPHSLAVSFNNDYSFTGHGKKGNGACSRSLYLDVTNFYGPVVTTPAPTVTLSASPSSVTAGQSATLTWNSTNASSCNASGAWNIQGLATSGSMSTGAINQTSTYSLMCSGDGGSASTSATVTVSSAGFTTSLTQGMTITPPYTWTFNPGVSSVKGYFFADGKQLASAAPDANGSYSFTIQSGSLTAGVHLLGHAWDLADGTHQSGPVNYSVTIANSGGATAGNLGSKLIPRMPESSGSKVLYVSPSGSGTSCSSSSPCSFTQVWSAAASGTIINLKGGAYTGFQTIQNRRYSSSNPVTLQSNPGETATFTGCTSSCGSNILYFGNDLGIRIRNITVTGTNSHGSAFKFDSSSYLELDHVVVHDVYGNGLLVVGDSGTGFVQAYSDHIQILNSTFYNTALNGGVATNQSDALYFGSGAYSDGVKHGVDSFLIANNVIYDQPNGFGIQLGNEASNGAIVNNTFEHAYGTVGDSGSGVMVWGKGDYPTNNVVIRNNIFASGINHAVQSNCSSALAGINLSGNLGYANGSPEYYGYYGSTLCFTPGTNFGDANPLFISVSGHDYRLQSGSPAIGKADPAYTPPYDHDGNARDSTPNLGAF
jgi:hypothetical protein